MICVPSQDSRQCTGYTFLVFFFFFFDEACIQLIYSWILSQDCINSKSNLCQCIVSLRNESLCVIELVSSTLVCFEKNEKCLLKILFIEKTIVASS